MTEGEGRVWRVPIQDPHDPEGIRSVLVAHGGPPIPTFADFERLFSARAHGELAIVHEVPDVTSPWTVYSDESWFSALPQFEREHLAFMVRFAPLALGLSRKPFFRMLAYASGMDASIDPDDDEKIVRQLGLLEEFETRIGRKLTELPSLADLDPSLLRMAEHCIQVAKAFKEKLSSEWSLELIENGLKSVASRGPAGRLAAQADLSAVRGFHSRLRVETADYFRDLAEEACLRLASQQFAMALERHRARPEPALTLRGLQRALVTRLAADLMEVGVSESESARQANKLLAHVLGPPFGGYRFARQSIRRWMRDTARR